MQVCDNCGKEVEAGQKFCPYCAQSLGNDAGIEGRSESPPPAMALQAAAEERGPFLHQEDLEPLAAVPLSSFGESKGEESKSQRKLFLIVGIASLVVLVGLVILFSTDAGRSVLQTLNPPYQEDRLEDAIRPGASEFEEAMQRVRLDFDADSNAFEASRAIGDKIFTLRPTIRNFTNRTLSGVELRAEAYDLEGNVIKGRTFVVIPKRQAELAPNNTYAPDLLLEGFKQDDFVANLGVKITGLKFKN